MNDRSEAQRHLATIRDPIALAHDAIGERHLDDRDECVSFLLEHLCRLAYRYNPDRDKAGPDFGGYAAHILRLRVTDYIRHTSGRTVWRFKAHTYRRQLPLRLSLDQKTGTEAASELGGSVSAWGGDLAPDSDSAFRRLVANRNSRRARDLEVLGIPPVRRAHRRDRGA